MTRLCGPLLALTLFAATGESAPAPFPKPAPRVTVNVQQVIRELREQGHTVQRLTPTGVPGEWEVTVVVPGRYSRTDRSYILVANHRIRHAGPNLRAAIQGMLDQKYPKYHSAAEING